MSSILFEHNQKAYESAVSMLKQTGKAAIVHPTGTGKSFLAFQLCADHKDKRVCWLSPSEYIFETQKEKWVSAGGGNLENIQFFTYARLMRMKEEALTEIRPDYIVLDEFHRCGAVQWGGGVKRLRERYPEAFVLGLSATGIRYLDNQRDMAWELFDGNIASELTLGAAIAKGILPAPKYVLSVYSYRRELQKYEARVRQTKNPAVRDQAEKELEALRRALEKADGLEEVFARHMLGKCGSDTENSDSRNTDISGSKSTDVEESGNGKDKYVNLEEYGNIEDEDADTKDSGNEKKTDFGYRSRGEQDGKTDKNGSFMLCDRFDYNPEKNDFKKEVSCRKKEMGKELIQKNEKEERKEKKTGKETEEAEKEAGKEIKGREIKKEEKSCVREEYLAEKRPDLGKYIVFCASYEHLCEMQELAPEWFAKVDARPHIYTAYSDDPAAAEEFQMFKADKSRHLKLLYCIDMLNEGIHVDDLDGVILLRPTVSPTIYKQQIGRALAAGGKKTPVIFDVVMNIENLCSIGVMEEELRSAVFAFRTNGRADEIVHEHFRVIDEVADCRKLFQQLNETLGASWEAMYAMAKEYFAEHGNLEVPAHYTTPEGYSLGAWINTQRKVFGGKTAGCLSEEQIKRLTAIGMRWQGVQERAWERNFAEAEKYFKEHGDLNVPADYVAESGCRLGRWVRRQKEKYQKTAVLRNEDGNQGNIVAAAEKGYCKNSTGKEKYKNDCEADEEGLLNLRLQRIKRLTQIGMVWENADPWERKFELARQYYEEHGSLRMAPDYVVEGVWLDRWLRAQKTRLEEESEARENTAGSCRNIAKEEEKKEDLQTVEAGEKSSRRLTAEQKSKLLSIGIHPGVSQAELSWREQYGEAEEFYRTHGNLSIPKRYAANNGKNLGVWLQHQRANRRNGRLAGWQVHLLDRIGMVWEAPDAWAVGFAHAKEYARQMGNLEVPNAYVCADGYRLGKWISNQRCAYRGCSGKELEPEQIRQLEAAGMVWNAKRGRNFGRLQNRERKRR